MNSLIETLTSQVYLLLTVIPPLLKAAAILLLGYIIARVLYQVIRRLIAASGLDRLTEKLLAIDLFRNLKTDILPSRIVAAVVYYFVLLVVFMAAVEALGMEMLSLMMADLVAYIPSAITAFIILVGGIFLSDKVRQVVASTCRSLGIAAAGLIANVTFYFLLLNVILIALSQAQLKTQFMETNISIILGGVAGAFAIGYGLASRHVIGNILASFYNRDRVNIGDEVSVDGQRGEIIQLSNLSITLRSGDAEYTVPFIKLSEEGFVLHSRRGEELTLPPESSR